MWIKGKAHRGKRRERKFETDDRLNVKDRAIAEYNYRKGYKKGREEGIREGIQEGIKQESENKKVKKRKKMVASCGMFALFFIVVAFSAWLCAVFEKVFVVVCTFATSFLGIGIVYPIKEKVKNNGDKKGDVQAGEGILQTALKGGMKLWKGVRNNSMSIFLIGLSVALFIGGAWGRFKMSVCLEKASQTFVETFMESNKETLKNLSNSEGNGSSDEENKPEQDDETDQDSQAVQSTQGDAPDEDAASDNEVTANEMETFFEESDINKEELRQIEIADTVILQELDLKDEEYIAVFFTGGEYQIEDWEDQQEINDKVIKAISDMREEEKISIFDRMASQNLKDEVERMKNTDETTKSFSEKQNISERRQKVYEDFPKRSFTSLISNSEQWQALALIYYNGQQKSIMYHYAQSIIWDMEYLKYKWNTEEDIKDRLLIIAQRYEDIAFICTNCSERKLAQRLQVAFENAAEQF